MMFNNRNICIRIAALSDLPQICGLYEEFYAYNAALQPDYYRAGKETGAYPRAVITGDSGAIFVAADQDDRIVGFVHIESGKTQAFSSLVEHNYVEVIDIIVTRNHRNQGIGAMLMERVKEWGISKDLDYIELFVLSDAKGEIAFYEREGFKEMSKTMRAPLK
ncbi:MAG: GNAT family N-acetyltransferase [Oscillospiraceae bacterium]|jgi:ribosomal protein S18 acetylase RimI-like enzyme|nr:GNAT family N-acetyltransferase [Oscillospiraceae bacterium]